MSFRLCILLAAWMLSVTSGLAAGDEAKKPSLLSRGWQLLHLGGGQKKAPSVHADNLVLTMNVAPVPLKLSEARQIKVALQLSNHSKKPVYLEFPTTQRFDVIVRDENGKTAAQWSEDQSFSNDSGYVTVNPGERIEYGALVSAREMKPGQTYIVEGFLPNYDQLKIQQSVVPQK